MGGINRKSIQQIIIRKWGRLCKEKERKKSLFFLVLSTCLRCLSLLLQTDELLETIVHLLNGLVFSETHAALVGDVVDATLSLGVLTTGSADLFLFKPIKIRYQKLKQY